VIPRLAALVAAGALLAACGGSDEGRFDDAVADVRAAVESGDREQALERLDGIALLATAAGQEGELEPSEVEEVASLVAQGRALVDQQLPPETTTTTEAPAPPTTQSVGDVLDGGEDGDDDEDDGKKGRGKGKGDDGDGDD